MNKLDIPQRVRDLLAGYHCEITRVYDDGTAFAAYHLTKAYPYAIEFVIKTGAVDQIESYIGIEHTPFDRVFSQGAKYEWIENEFCEYGEIFIKWLFDQYCKACRELAGLIIALSKEGELAYRKRMNLPIESV